MNSASNIAFDSFFVSHHRPQSLQPSPRSSPQPPEPSPSPQPRHNRQLRAISDGDLNPDEDVEDDDIKDSKPGIDTLSVDDDDDSVQIARQPNVDISLIGDVSNGFRPTHSPPSGPATPRIVAAGSEPQLLSFDLDEEDDGHAIVKSDDEESDEN